MKNMTFRKSLTAAAVAASLGFPALAVAQDNQNDTDTAAEEVERIQVTGSRIKRTDLETASPVEMVSSEEVKASGFTRVEDLMATLPQLETATQNSFVANGAAGVANLDLRGLGANRTLVLVNGRRLQPGGVYSQAADVNQIPTALIERVEVLTGGGSSTYGSDAVAGVVNFVMKKDIEGFEVTLGTSGYQHDNSNSYMQGLMDEAGYDYPEGGSGIDGKTYTVDVTGGSMFAGGKGSASFYATFRTNEELLQAERDYSSCALNGAGTSCGGSATAPVPNFFISPIEGGSPNFDEEVFWSLTEDGSFAPFTDNVYNYAPINHFMRPNDRYTFGSFVNYEANDHFRPYLETSYMHDRTAGQIAQSGVFFQNFAFDVDSDVFSDTQRQQFRDQFGADTDQIMAYIGKRNVEGGPRINNLEHNSYRIVTGATGELSAMWEYDVSFQYGSTQSSSVYINDFYVPRMPQVLGAAGADECGEDCIPYEVFKYQGVTAEAADALGGTAILTGLTTQRIINAFVTGETGFSMPSSNYNVAAVFGVENREVDFERVADEVYQLGALSGQGGPTDSLIGGYNVSEVFTEINVPLVEDASWANNLQVDLGYRYSDYSSSGGEPAYKLGLDWQVNDDYKIRGTYNRAVRAPNVAELFATQGIGLWAGVDPCAGGDPQYTQEQCANTGVSAGQYGNVSANPAGQYNAIFGGNPDLDPELADTMTFGIVGNPTDNFNFSIDYWNIEMEDRIGTISAELIIRQCAETGEAQWCDAITRSPSGDLWRGTDGFVTATSVNLAESTNTGIDTNINYNTEIGGGQLAVSLTGTYYMTKETTTVPGLAGTTIDCAGVISSDCFPQAEWRHSMNFTYSTGDWWSVGAKWRYLGSVDYDGETDELIGDGLGSTSYIDLNANFDVTENVSVLLGMNNALDKEPTIVGDVNSLNGNTIAGYHDALGRYVFGSVTFRF
ncbi:MULTISPECIES: TonB-dependent receptor domain-containing protein [Idiomarina]|uniref:TonB-dependent receptor domain-containing protein n=1 Tax=Idiomarina TaxID=135575 RepID=UPI000C3F7B79|nr:MULTISPECIES: TonB-dependent receptor [Idiomarina]MBH94393.1 TonB-dependent receptor [Idiomarina sp.]RDX35158.1 TonB-dependent receptor [Idiomarina sp. HD9-110m-PIT-SAG05]|tara:strand:- start:8288 stop:11146 length:2859 start_codon:yes stop_codon:yes gene_type:complete